MNASELRLKARTSLTGNYWHSVLVAFVAAIFGALITSSGTIDLNSGTIDLSFTEELSEVVGEMPRIVALYLAILGGAAGVLSLVTFILGGVIQLGYAQYLLKQQDGEINQVKDLFSQFDRFGQGFLQAFLRALFIGLWSLLFIIPGIVKSFAYSMTPFIMAENPELTAKEAIKISQERMKGHKWELFCLGFSFIGWNILAALTAGIGMFFLNPYTNAAFAAFYRDKISPKAVPVTFVYEEPPVLE